MRYAYYHDGRGPELMRVVWKRPGVIMVGFEYHNPDDSYSKETLKHLKLVGVEAFAYASEEVHGNILASGESKAAIFKLCGSEWLSSFQQRHLEKCSHFQIMFYDEVYDVVCEEIVPGKGRLGVAEI